MLNTRMFVFNILTLLSAVLLTTTMSRHQPKIKEHGRRLLKPRVSQGNKGNSSSAVLTQEVDPVAGQLIFYKENTEGPIGLLTTSAGAPVPYDEATNTLNTQLMNNEFFMDTLTHLVRERIPERYVHAQGTGAFGYFQVTHDITRICKADFLKKVGMKTPVAVRLSSSSGFRGSTEFNLDIRGFAVKFYTRDGNFDIAGFNTPTSNYNEPLHVLPILHTTRRNPVTNIADANMFWEFVTTVPESLHSTLLLMSGRGLPASYCNMPGFGIHTYQVENEKGVCHYVKFHIMPDAGIKNLKSEVARNFTAFDPDFLSKDLYRAIANGDLPSWTVSVQILTEANIKKLGHDAFDITRIISLKDFPLHPVGKIVLTRNPDNFFADVEQMAFSPGNLVRGILGSPDKLFQARRVCYRDTHLYRLGVNFNKIPVNCPFQTKTYTYNRDGVPPVGDNGKDAPNYYPNTFHGPLPYLTSHSSKLIEIIEKRGNNSDQVTELYENGITSEEKEELIKNVGFSLSAAAEHIKQKAIALFTIVHKDLGSRVAHELKKLE